jgi:methionyl-tRNA formyltransferase
MGDEVTGVTIMRVVLEMDAGDILLQEEVPILPEDTSATLGERLGVLGGELLARTMGLIESGEAVSTPQDPSKVTVCKLFKKAHGQIRWASPARDIHNLVRAAIPWPVAHCGYRGETCRLHKTEVIEDASDGEPGTVTAVEKDRVVVATGEGSLAILVFQAPGKRAMPMADFLRGHPIEVGERFEDL